jgi:histidinol-phosphate/aromatic aminotransferase/cobyric acid decarboxylase-like protein
MKLILNSSIVHPIRCDSFAKDDIVVLRTFSKIHGLAGLRIGYAVGNG